LSRDAEEKQSLQAQLNALQESQRQLQTTLRLIIVLLAILLLLFAWYGLLS